MGDSDADLEMLESKAARYRSKGDFDKVIMICKDILNRHADNPAACEYACAQIGDVYLAMRELEPAEEYLKKAMAYDPLNPKYHYLLGFVYSVSRQWDRAIKEFEFYLKKEPDESEYLRGLGWALWSASKKAEGLRYLQRAIGVAPENVNALIDLAAASLGDGAFDEAHKYAEQALKVDPENSLAKKVLNSTERFQGAIPDIRRVGKESQLSVYEMKVRLKGSRPAIWRRFRLSGDTTLYKLHRILQALMGWSDYHLYEFRIGQLRFGEPDPDYSPETRTAKRVRLSDILKAEKARFTYVYDFGDDWQHEIVVERILPSAQKLRHPVCIGGERACPPEDCGGVWGYSRLLKVIRNPRDEEYEETMEWLGGDFDPERFEPDKVNRRLKSMR